MKIIFTLDHESDWSASHRIKEPINSTRYWIWGPYDRHKSWHIPIGEHARQFITSLIEDGPGD